MCRSDRPYEGIPQFQTNGWGAYERHLEPVFHTVGKVNTQTIERKHLTLRTRITEIGSEKPFVFPSHSNSISSLSFVTWGKLGVTVR